MSRQQPKEFDPKSARKKRPLPLWVDALTRDCALLEADELGAYFSLLMAMWSARDACLPFDHRKLARAARVSQRLWKSRIWPSLEPHFFVENDRLYQKRLLEEAALCEDYLAKQSARSQGPKNGTLPESEACALPEGTHKQPEKDGENSDKSLENIEAGQTVDTSASDPPTHPTYNPTYIIGGGGSAHARTREGPPPENEDPFAEIEAPPTFRDRLLAACGVDPSGLTGRGGAILGDHVQMVEADRWISELGLTQDQAVEEVRRMIGAKRDGPPTTLSYFTPGMRRLAGNLSEAQNKPMEAIHGKPAGNPNHRPHAASGHGRSSLASVAARRRAAGADQNDFPG